MITQQEVNLIRAVASGETAESAGTRMGLPSVLVDHICRKWAKRGFYTYRVSPGVGWLTDSGRKKAAESKGDVRK